MRRMPLNAENLENFLFLSENFDFQNEKTIEICQIKNFSYRNC